MNPLRASAARLPTRSIPAAPSLSLTPAASSHRSSIDPLRASTGPPRSFSTSSVNRKTWGFIGLGRMGNPMAKNLRAKIPAEDTLLIADRETGATDKFVKEVGNIGGLEVCKGSKEVAERSEVIITVLPEPSHVKNVFHTILRPPLGPPPDGTERLFIDCSTIDPTSSKEVANAVHSTSQGRFVDAPMSGGVVGARAGTLTFMLGASSRSGDLIQRVRPILGMMGTNVVHMGGQGAGLSGKLANNYLLAVSNIATAEAMNLGLRWGLDPVGLGQLINGSSGRCWSSEVNNPVKGVSKGAPVEEDYEGGFAIELMKKDLRLAMDAARRVGAKVEMGERAGDIYDLVESEGEKGKDFSVVYRWISQS